MMDFEQWKGFEKGEWKRQINVRDFIQKITHLMLEIQAF